MAELSIKSATLYNAISKYASMIIQLALTMILSRLIAPEAYGIIAIISVIIGFLNLFADMGLGVSIIQHPEMSKEDVEKLFSFSIIIGVILSVITIILAHPLSLIYKDTIFRKLCPLVSFVSLFNAINIVPNAILVRDKKFKIIALRSVLCSIFSGIVAVILAYFNYGVYALIVQSIISSAFLFIWNYSQTSLKVKQFEKKYIFSLLGKYSLFQVLFNFLNYLTRNLDNLIIGKYFGTEELAYYNKSYYLFLYPNNIFASVLTGVIHPYIREYKCNRDKMYEKYIQIEKILSLIGIFTMTLFFFCSKEIIIIMFGNNWEPATYCLRGLSICMWTQMMGSVAGSFFLGLERTEQTFKCGIINLFLIIVSILLGVYFKNIVLLSFFIGISYNLIFIITNYILIKTTLGFSLTSFAKKIMLDGFYAFTFILISLSFHDLSPNVYVNFVFKFSIVVIFYLMYLIISKQFSILYSLFNLMKK